jgi:hypothetical protein
MGLISARYNVITTVVTPAASYALADLTTIKAELEETTVDAARDAIISRYIAEASAAAHNYCNRIFVVETVKDTFFPKRDAQMVALDAIEPLQLSRWPLASVDAVIFDGRELVENVDFLVDQTNGQLIRLNTANYPIQWDPYPITVQYDAGYQSMPEDIAGAVVLMVTRRWFVRGRDPMARRESINGVWDMSYFSDQEVGDGLWMQMLDKYRAGVLA